MISLPLQDQAARDRIFEDLDGNLLVEAGAGSGKTTALVGRMIALVERDKATVDEMAAVTFTRKAAGELRERFQTQLEKRIREEVSEPSDRAVLDRLRSALDDIDRIFVGTIHAFCARLLRERPLEVGLDPAFEELAAEERVRLRRRFWDAYLERLTRDADPILEELAESGLRPVRLWGLFEQLVENPDVDFPTTATEMPSFEELRGVQTELESIVDYGWELMPEHEPEKSWDSLQKKVRTAHFMRDVTGWKDPADLFEALALFCKSGPHPHKVTQKRWKNGPMAKALAERATAFGVGRTPAQALLGRWYAHRYALAVRLALHAAEDFAEHRRRTGRVDFQDLLVLTARLLRSQPDVRRQLGRRYRRLLIDEFQDTDPLQAEIMMLLASDPEDEAQSAGETSPASGGGAAPGDPGPEQPLERVAAPHQIPSGPGMREGESEESETDTPDQHEWRSVVPREGALFVVGDPKQSIYRFRRADIQLYGFVKDRFTTFGTVLELTTNFRSRPPIGDLVNEQFGGPDFFPDEATHEQAAFEPLNTRPTPEGGRPGGVFWYVLDPTQSVRRAVAEDDAARIASHIAGCIQREERSPGDFLILTRKRTGLAAYARALEARSIPVQVTGAGVGVEMELRELRVLLECMIDPSNPVRVVAALVGLFFGIDYERLVQHRIEGGGFDATASREHGHPDVLDAMSTLRGWWRAATVEPADVFVSRVTMELGLLPYAAAGELGSLRAGALVYALDAVRASALAGDASLPGALQALQSALDLAEAEAPLEPGRPDVVRLMNLHQAKGLEAEVVFLADPSGAKSRKPEIHMRRTASGHALGYLRVTEARAGWGGDIMLARPEGWEEKEQAEQGFAAAEEVRLLYVAVTRAKEELFVARWPKKPAASPWKPLDGWLDDRGEQVSLEIVEPQPREPLETSLEVIRDAVDGAARTLAAMSAPSYAHRSVTDMAKTSAADDPLGSGKEVAPGDTSVVGEQGFRGFSWGSAVHGALAAAVEGLAGEALSATCRDLLIENERPVDDHGDPAELAELLEVVVTVRGSELWARAHRSKNVLAEVPFAVEHNSDVADLATSQSPEPTRTPRRQLDLFGTTSETDAGSADPEVAGPAGPVEGDPVPQILEGVIDLAFREPDGWVIADYKTDLGTDPEFPSRLKGYRRQVELYADAWARLTREKVKERVLFFTTQGKVERW